LACNVVLHLMICFDLMLQLYEFLGARIDAGENPKTHDAHQDQKHRNCKKCRKQLGFDASGQSRNEAY